MVRLVVLYWTVQTMMRPFVAPYALSLGAGTTAVGATLAASAIPAAILCIPTGLYCDRLGGRAVVTAGALSSAVGATAMALAPDVAVLLASQVLVGTGQMAMWLAIQGMMVGDPESGDAREVRARRVVNYSSFGFVGQLLGPLLGGYLVQWWGYGTAFGVAAGLSALSFGGMVASGERRPQTPRWIPLREAAASYRTGFSMMGHRGVAVTMAISFSALLLLDVRVSLHPLYFSSIGIESHWIGWILVTGTVFSFLSRNVLMAIVGKVRDGALIALMLGASGAAISAVVLTESLVGIMILSALGGAAIGMVQPLTILLTAEHSPPTATGVGLGLRILANRGAQAADPVLFAGLTPLAGLAPAIGVIGLLAGAVGILSGRLLDRAPPGFSA